MGGERGCWKRFNFGLMYMRMCIYNKFWEPTLRFEWDETKSAINLRKHGIAFETAVLVFDDPQQLLLPDRVVDGSNDGRRSDREMEFFSYW